MTIDDVSCQLAEYPFEQLTGSRDQVREIPRRSASWPSRRESLFFVLDEESLGFRMQVVRMAVGNRCSFEERNKLAVGMEIAGSERHRALAVAD